MTVKQPQVNAIGVTASCNQFQHFSTLMYQLKLEDKLLQEYRIKFRLVTNQGRHRV